jgi:hypothetical protein
VAGDSGSGASPAFRAAAASLAAPLLLISCGCFSEVLKVAFSVARPLPPALLAELQASALEPAAVDEFMRAALSAANKVVAPKGEAS